MKLQEIQNDYQVIGDGVNSIFNALREYSSLFKEILEEKGYDQPQNGEWYPLTHVLDILYTIEVMMGPSTLFEIGKQVNKNVPIPTEINSIEKAILAAPMIYKSKHAKNGVCLFELDESTTSSDIGYVRSEIHGQNSATIIEYHPYPADLGRGIYFSLFRRFQSLVKVDLEISDKGEKIFKINW